MGQTIGIYFGALSHKLEDQLRSQGVTLEHSKMKMYQLDYDQLVRLLIRGYLTESQYDQACKKFMKKINKDLIKVKELEVTA